MKCRKVIQSEQNTKGKAGFRLLDSKMCQHVAFNQNGSRTLSSKSACTHIWTESRWAQTHDMEAIAADECKGAIMYSNTWDHSGCCHADWEPLKVRTVVSERTLQISNLWHGGKSRPSWKRRKVVPKEEAPHHVWVQLHDAKAPGVAIFGEEHDDLGWRKTFSAVKCGRKQP